MTIGKKLSESFSRNMTGKIVCDFFIYLFPLIHIHASYLHGHDSGDILAAGFVKKYIQFVKQYPTIPHLSDEAMDFISESYCKLRSNESSRALPVTARLLETLIRLSTAHARCRLASSVTLDDCTQAFAILSFAMYTEGNPARDDNTDDERISVPRIRSHSSKMNDSSGEDDEEDIIRDDNKLSRAARKIAGLREGPTSEATTDHSQPKRTRCDNAGDIASIDRARYNQFQRGLVTFMTRMHLDPCTVEEALAGVNSEPGVAPFTREEIIPFLVRLELSERIMFNSEDDNIHLM
jgi:hypothetical protein